MTFRWILIAFTVLALTGCASSTGYDSGAFTGILQSAPVDLSGEQVTLTQTQVDCGVKNELWEPPNGNLARLTQKGRDLKFSDDIRVTDPEITHPYSQLTGPFPVQVSDVSKIRDTDNGMKLADVKLGAVMVHECFTAPLPVMGIRKGKFATDVPVVFRFKGSGAEWSLDKLVH